MNRKNIFQNFKDSIKNKEFNHFNIIIKQKNKSQVAKVESIKEDLGSLFIFNDKGKREYNEDRVVVNTSSLVKIFAIFDGHGGSQCANLMREHFGSQIQNIFQKYFKDVKQFNAKVQQDIQRRLGHYFEQLHEMLVKNKTHVKYSGSTVSCAIVFLDKLIVVNLGDSRIVGVTQQFTFTRLSIDHKPVAFEKELVRSKGGTVEDANTKVPRVNGLAMSRSIGDIDNEHIERTPDFFFYNRNDFIYFILASDGLWDCISDDQTVQHLNEYFCYFDKHSSVSPLEFLYNKVQKRVYDNISMCLFFQDDTCTKQLQ